MAVTRDGRLEKELNSRFHRAAPSALTAAGAVVITQTQRIFVLFRPRGWATGRTVRSLTVGLPERNASGYRMKIGPTTNYAWFIHEGRKLGKPPPVQAIVDWVREKHLSGMYSVSTHKRLGSKTTQSAEDLSAAFAIARAIGEHGTQPFPFLRVGLMRSRREAMLVFRRVLIAGMVIDG